MKNDVKVCEVCKKHCYPSESAATRAMNKYPDIKRVYMCSEGNWHTTSMGIGLAIQEGIVAPEKKQEPTKEQLEERLEYLRKKVETELKK